MKTPFLPLLLMILLLLAASSCQERKSYNTTNLEQINIDNSNNYSLIFKERIEKERQEAAFDEENQFFD